LLQASLRRLRPPNLREIPAASLTNVHVRGTFADQCLDAIPDRRHFHSHRSLVTMANVFAVTTDGEDPVVGVLRTRCLGR